MEKSETPRRGPGRPRKQKPLPDAVQDLMEVRNPARRPVIEDAPTRELEAIIEKGTERSKDRGHAILDPWKMAAEWGELRCRSCRRTLYVAVQPIPGGPQFGGPAIDEKCQ